MATIFDVDDVHGIHIRVTEPDGERRYIPMKRLEGVRLPVLEFKPIFEGVALMTAAQLVKSSIMGAVQDINDFHRGAGGHIGTRAQLVKHAERLGIRLTGKLRMCEACHMGALIKNSIPVTTDMILTVPGQLTYLDLTGPFPVPEPDSNFLYCGMLVDAVSTRPTPMFMQRKQEIPMIIEAYHAMLKSAGYKMTVLRVDGDKANVTNSVGKVLERLNIHLEMSYPNAAQLMGMVERVAQPEST